jgi:hypothetical protein
MLSFPNPSRSYAAATDRISFWGHDGTTEVPFFLQANALFRLFPRTAYTESAILDAFDAGLQRIHEIAGKAYARAHRRFYVLGPENI